MSTSLSRNLIFGVPIFLSATLLFWIQPLFTKLLLPGVGGAAAVWSTAILFFQVTLLMGYLYVHLLTRIRSPIAQVALHLIVLTIAALFLPPALPEGWRPLDPGSPIQSVLLVMILTIGPPFFVISATAPLLQRWLAYLGERGGIGAVDPYVLYAASNLGSLIALFSFPFFIEPFFLAGEQLQAWSAGFLLLGVMIAGLGVVLWRAERAGAPSGVPGTTPAGAPVSRTIDDEEEGELDLPVPAMPSVSSASERWRDRAWWTFLAFVPSTLMLSTTEIMTNDVAPMPFFWAIPLALYLLTYAIAFAGEDGIFGRNRWVPVVRFMGLPAVLAYTAFLFWPMIPGHAAPFILAILIIFFFIALTAHMALREAAPEAERLTEFYLFLAIGGAAGGVLNGFIAPMYFPPVPLVELGIGVIGAILIIAAHPSRYLAGWPQFGVAMLLAVLTTGVFFTPSGMFVRIGLAGLVIACALSFWRDRPRIAASTLGMGACAFLVVAAWTGADYVYSDRTFYGRLFVHSSDGITTLVHGSTIHGFQSNRPGEETLPTSYHHPEGPLGDVFDAYPTLQNEPVAIVGLGAGAMACYGTPASPWLLIEIDPVIVDLALDPSYFSFVERCTPSADIAIGDGRIVVQEAPEGFFSAIMLDAFNSDAPPVHLLTAEAIDLYFSRMDDQGLLLVNTSNRHLDLTGVVGATLLDGGYHVAFRPFNPEAKSESEGQDLRAASVWVVGSRDRAMLDPFLRTGEWHLITEPRPGLVWSDRRSSLLTPMVWHMAGGAYKVRDDD